MIKEVAEIIILEQQWSHTPESRSYLKDKPESVIPEMLHVPFSEDLRQAAITLGIKEEDIIPSDISNPKNLGLVRKKEPIKQRLSFKGEAIGILEGAGIKFVKSNYKGR